MAKTANRNDRNRKEIQAGLPGDGANAIFNLLITNFFPVAGEIEIEAVSWNEAEKRMKAFVAWPQDLIIGAPDVKVWIQGEEKAINGETFDGSLMTFTTEQLSGVVEIWIKPGARRLASRRGWICAGLRQTLDLPIL